MKIQEQCMIWQAYFDKYVDKICNMCYFYN